MHQHETKLESAYEHTVQNDVQVDDLQQTKNGSESPEKDPEHEDKVTAEPSAEQHDVFNEGNAYDDDFYNDYWYDPYDSDDSYDTIIDGFYYMAEHDRTVIFPKSDSDESADDTSSYSSEEEYTAVRKPSWGLVFGSEYPAIRDKRKQSICSHKGDSTHEHKRHHDHSAMKDRRKQSICSHKGDSTHEHKRHHDHSAMKDRRKQSICSHNDDSGQKAKKKEHHRTSKTKHDITYDAYNPNENRVTNLFSMML